MSKRRRASSVTGRGDDDESDSQPASEPNRKKKKLDPVDMAQILYDTIRNHKKEDGTLLCDSFIRAPKRRQEPLYYEVVQNPIDLLKVQQKLKTDEYEDMDEVVNDIELLVNNAKSFYKRNTQEFKDAAELWDLVQATKVKILEESKSSDDEPKGKILLKTRKSGPASSSSSSCDIKREDNEDTSESSSVTNDDEINMCEELFNILMTASSEDGRPLYPAFQLLPSKKRYPNYYEVIEQPIDLRQIATKIQQNKYSTLSEMEKDLLTLTKNACTFNEPGSQIYKDAKALRKLTIVRKIDIELGKIPPSKERGTRGKRTRNSQSFVAVTAALKSDEEEEEEESGLCDGEEDHPQWQLFNTVKNYTNSQGELMSEPFYRLPSKRVYPDYYDEIKNPVSLTQICKKLQKGHYETVSEVAGDLNIMFENAKNYNRPDSKLYKCAVKLQKIMQKRFQELLEVDNQYTESEDDSMDEPPRKTSSGGSSPMMSGKPPSKLLTRGKYLDNIPLKQSQPEGGGGQTPSTSKVLTKGKYLDNLPLKRRIYSLCKCLMTFVCEDGRQPMLMFMEKPSAKLYPDYYEVIEQPIDMLTIQANIKAEKYQSEEEILADFKLMFRNCQKYNEMGSLIYDDASKLEKILMDKVKELGPLPPPCPNSTPKIPKPATPNTTVVKLKPGRPPNSALHNSPVKPVDTNLSRKLRLLYHSVRDFRDPKGRQLSQIFIKLPLRSEYPDYYEVIKRPIDLEQISMKAKSGIYETLDDLCSDFILMFDNACKYNEPDSQIYKDALILQRVTMQTKLQLRQDESGVPDVPAAVQELLHSLFTSVYNHQDEEGRCFSDSMQELPEHDEVDGKKVRGLSLDLIKRRLDAGQYKRLDMFQEDVFACLLRARTLSRSDSQVFEDSVELQSYFIRQRDELCKNGDFLSSPALNFTLMELSAAVDLQRQAKQANEQPVDDENSVDIKMEIKEEAGSGGTGMAGVADNALSYNQQVYRIGDFVYAESNEKGMEPIILNILRLWTNQEGQQMLYGNHFYRPDETFHVATRKFLEKEVFKTDQNVAIPLNQVLGRCCIMSVKDYFRFKPENVDDKDVYVCESRYSTRARSFKKIKITSAKSWPPTLMAGYKLVPREEPLEPKRVMSVFRQRMEKHMEEIAELEDMEKLVEKAKPNVPLKDKIVDGWIHYEQYNAPNCLIKTGDCVFIKSDAGRQLVALIDTIWTNDEGVAFFRGPWVVFPSEMPPSLLRNPFKQEIYLSTLEDTHPVNNILGKCAILVYSDYVSSRPTEISERAVFLCENIYDEAKRTVRELGREGLKKYSHSKEVLQDEIYYFKRIISLRNPPKTQMVSTTSNTETIPQAPVVSTPPAPIIAPATPVMNHYENSVDSDVVMEDSMDGPPPSISSDTSIVSTPTTSVKKTSKPGSGKKLVTGYILYSGEVRKGITQSNPECNFGEVSRLVGNEWRKLAASEKAAWEEKAARMNEENQNESNASGANASGQQSLSDHVLIFECCWHDCDWQFEDVSDAIEHACNDSSGHVYQFFAPIPPSEAEYQCHWRGCCRTTKKTIPPFPNLHRLARHVREVHLLKSTGRSIHPDFKSKHYLTSRKAAAAALQAAAQAAKNPPLVQALGLSTQNSPNCVAGNIVGANGKIFEPMFVTVPPRPQKLLHSEAYIKYIEGLTPENRNISNWDKQLRAVQSSIEQTDKSRLPAHWLANGVGNHGNILNALWTLRDFMFRDALGISKHL